MFYSERWKAVINQRLDSWWCGVDSWYGCMTILVFYHVFDKTMRVFLKTTEGVNINAH